MIYITRHGQTDWNALGKVMGRYDEPLNNTGLNQAIEVKAKLANTHIDLIICSPLQRAKQTAQIINENRNIPIIYDERIIERDFGEFEGKNTNSFDFLKFWDYYENGNYEKAENIQDFFKRVYDFLEDILKTHYDKNILIVAHGGISIPINCFFNDNIPKGSLANAHLVLENCQVARYEDKKKICDER